MPVAVAFLAIAVAAVQPGAYAGSLHVADRGRQKFLHAGIVNSTSHPLGTPASWESWGFSPATADIPPFMVKLGNECQCQFHGACTCKDTLAFMDCIATACSSGKCTCPADQYHQSCLAMEGACLDLEFECSNNRVKCSAHAKHPWDEDKKGLLEALEEMRVKKCKLKEASEAGWVNADNRMRELEPKIQDAIRKLKALGGEPPDMDCDGSSPTVVKEPVSRTNYSDIDYVESGTITREEEKEKATAEKAPVPATREPAQQSSHKKTCLAFVLVFLVALILRCCCAFHPTLNALGSVMNIVVIIVGVWYVISAGLWHQFINDSAASMDIWCWSICMFMLVSIVLCCCECVFLILWGLAALGVGAAVGVKNMFSKKETA